MSDKTIIHTRVSGPVDDAEMERISELIRDSLEEWGLDAEYKGFVTGDDVAITEVPAVDEYVDELAEAVAAKLEG